MGGGASGDFSVTDWQADGRKIQEDSSSRYEKKSWHDGASEPDTCNLPAAKELKGTDREGWDMKVDA